MDLSTQSADPPDGQVDPPIRRSELIEALSWAEDPVRGRWGVEYATAVLEAHERCVAADAAESAEVKTEWAVDGSFGVARVIDEAVARHWVKSYADHPDALDPGERMPVVVSRMVATTLWVISPPPV